MIRVLFDKNVPYKLRSYLRDCEIDTAEDLGWGQVSNGELMLLAERTGHELLLTADQSLEYQQNLTERKISLIVLGSNLWPGVRTKIDDIVTAVARVRPGSFEFIEIPHLPRRRKLPDRSPTPN